MSRTMFSRSVVSLMFVWALALSTPATAQVPCEVAELSASDNPAGTNSFAESVAISGDYVVAGASNDDEVAEFAGAAYVFKRVGPQWLEQVKVFGSEIGFHDNFGWSVDIDGSRLIVGAPFLDPVGSAPGQAYIFERTGVSWSQTERLLPSVSNNDDRYGYDVAMAGDIAVVGALLGGQFSGRAFVFRWNGVAWIEEAILAGDSGLDLDNFGISVAVHGDVAVVGAVQDGGEDGPGAAYVFRRNGGLWANEVKLTADVPVGGDNFGSDVSVNGDTILVGVLNDSTQAPSAGAVYVFQKTGGAWNHDTTLFSPNPVAFGRFGRTVSFDGARAVISDEDQSGYLLTKGSIAWSTARRLDFAIAADVDGTYAALNRRIYALDPVSPCIPAISTWGVVMLIITLLSSATILLRKSKKIIVVGLAIALLPVSQGNAAHLDQSAPIGYTASGFQFLT